MEHTQSHAHPKPNYVGIFVWLAVFTVIEVGISQAPSGLLPMAFQIGLLVTLASLKALLVVMYYMHLRYDSRWYTLILIVGVFFALLVGRFLPAIMLAKTGP